MKTNKFMFFLSLCLLLFAVACEDDGIEADEFTHSYEQTQCSDPWGNDSDAQKFVEAVEDYLQGKGITVLDSKVESVGGNFCAACTCPTGNTLKIRVSYTDAQTLMDLNEGWVAL